MALAVGTSVLIALLFTTSIRYMYQGGAIQRIEWDCATVTAGDYAVEFPIKRESYEEWEKDVYRKPNGAFDNGIPPAVALKKQLKEDIEDKLASWIRDNKWAQEELNGKSKKKSAS